MRWAGIIVGVLLTILGIVWTLQGINVIQGTAVSGDPSWTIIGVVLLITGPLLTYLGWLRGKPSA